MQMQWRVLQLADVVRLETVELASRQQVHEAQVMMMLSLSIAVCGVDAKEGATGEEEQARSGRDNRISSSSSSWSAGVLQLTIAAGYR